MRSKPLVFISSTSDLATEREAVAAALLPDFVPYLYEQDHAQRRSPEERCREMIAGADFFIGLLGERYGTPFPGAREGRSIVEWEFDMARARAELPVMAFLKQMRASDPGDPRQRRLVERLTQDFRSGLWYKAFSSTAELVALVKTSLTASLLEFWARLKESSYATALPRLRLLTAIAIVTVVGVATVSITPLREQLSKAALVALSAAGGSVVLLCLVLILTELGGRHDHPKP
jgi:hypothetical protein